MLQNNSPKFEDSVWPIEDWVVQTWTHWRAMLESGCKPPGRCASAVHRTRKQQANSGADRSPIKSMQVQSLLALCVRVCRQARSPDQSTGERGWQNNDPSSVFINLSFSFALQPYPLLSSPSSSSFLLTYTSLFFCVHPSHIHLFPPCHTGPRITPLCCL